MSFRTILVPVEQHDLMSSTLETALCLAKKFDSYIEGFALRVESPAAHAMGDAAAVMIPELELTRQRCQASGWKMPLQGTIL